jgi:hypothetical protein
VAGEMLLAKGVSEVATGTVATATGASGVVANAVTQLISDDSDEILANANKQNDELEEKAGVSAEDINQTPTTTKSSNTETESDVETETDTDTDAEQSTITENTPEENEFISEMTQLSASASTNINVNDITLTDDKADKKLSRFNTESIIESKKKMKKVQAVSASSGGKA